MKYPNGVRYEGNWKNGMWHGDGTVTHADETSETKLWYHNSDQEVINVLETELKVTEDELDSVDRITVNDSDGSSFKYFE